MAKTDDRLKISSCPICGYTDSASDPEALYSAIEEHVRMVHNMDLKSLNTETEIKTTDEKAEGWPITPPSAGTGYKVQ
jgi:hypothetical protein